MIINNEEVGEILDTGKEKWSREGQKQGEDHYVHVRAGESERKSADRGNRRRADWQNNYVERENMVLHRERERRRE